MGKKNNFKYTLNIILKRKHYQSLHERYDDVWSLLNKKVEPRKHLTTSQNFSTIKSIDSNGGDICEKHLPRQNAQSTSTTRPHHQLKRVEGSIKEKMPTPITGMALWRANKLQFILYRKLAKTCDRKPFRVGSLCLEMSSLGRGKIYYNQPKIL